MCVCVCACCCVWVWGGRATARPKSVSLAHELRDALKGGLVGAADDRLINMLTHRCKREIRSVAAAPTIPSGCETDAGVRCRETAEAYKTLFGKSLTDDLRAATSGWYRRTLLYIVREASQMRVHVAKPWLRLQRDIDV
jgi:hypothetical protein